MSAFEDQIADAASAYDLFTSAGPIYVARAPGRLDVMGGNVDYTGGMVLQALLCEAVWVAAQARTDGGIRIVNAGAAKFGWETRFNVQMSDLRDVEAYKHSARSGMAHCGVVMCWEHFIF